MGPLLHDTGTRTRHTGDPTSETIHSSSSRAVGASFAMGGYLGARERDAREPPRAVRDVNFVSGRNENF
jgi:hypothetical protein